VPIRHKDANAASARVSSILLFGPALRLNRSDTLPPTISARESGIMDADNLLGLSLIPKITSLPQDGVPFSPKRRDTGKIRFPLPSQGRGLGG